MKSSVILSFLFLLLLAACHKDKFETKPSIRIKTYNTKLVSPNGSLIVTLECTDKEGDVQDSLTIIKTRQNIRVVPTVRDILRYKFPTFPKNTTTEITTTLDYQSILSAINPPNIPGSNPPQKESDTLQLGFVVRDNAGNTSDTITSDRIIVIRQ
jgi:hypothetical protein